MSCTAAMSIDRDKDACHASWMRLWISEAWLQLPCVKTANTAQETEHGKALHCFLSEH